MKVFKDKAFTQSCGDAVSYGFFGRTGGISEGLYASLNCSRASSDLPEHVETNRSIVAQHLNYSGLEISTPWQCHSAECFNVDSSFDRSNCPNGDALVTDAPGVPIGILTADCGPVLFIGEKANGAPVIGAAHAGWGGALAGVLENTVTQMVRLSAAVDTICACLGPCILQASYEVQEEFATPFLKAHDTAERFFMASRKSGHLMFDLAGYIAFRLAHVGLKQISLMGVDTYTDRENCFSYRRAMHKGEPDYGRQISAIVIR